MSCLCFTPFFIDFDVFENCLWKTCFYEYAWMPALFDESQWTLWEIGFILIMANVPGFFPKYFLSSSIFTVEERLLDLKLMQSLFSFLSVWLDMLFHFFSHQFFKRIFIFLQFFSIVEVWSSINIIYDDVIGIFTMNLLFLFSLFSYLSYT